MFVVDRKGQIRTFNPEEITIRNRMLTTGLSSFVDLEKITSRIVEGFTNGMTTVEIDQYASEIAAYLTGEHPDYGVLAGRISVANLHRNTPNTFSEAMEALHQQHWKRSGANSDDFRDEEGYMDATFMSVVRKYATVLNEAIDHAADFNCDYFSISTWQKSYLMTDSERPLERPQYAMMRIAVFLNMHDVPLALKTYRILSAGGYTHASPTIFNAGKKKSQCSSCFLLQMESDSVEGIYNTIKASALISKEAGGIGLAVHKIRAKGALIKGSGGHSDGIIPMLKVFQYTARYIDQGGNKRKGAFAVYLEPWHTDIFEFLDLRKNHGFEADRARDLFLGLWIPDLFMERVEMDQSWTLFSPDTAIGLHTCYGSEFDRLYVQYEADSQIPKRVVRARDLWQAIITAQLETGNPYMMYKDACNNKSNHKHLGTIQCSNLCTEIVEYTAPDEVAVCNLSSVALPHSVKRDSNGQAYFDHQNLYEVTYLAAWNCDSVIDLNYYPVPEAKNSNIRHRPIGLGVQGLADVFHLLQMAFDSDAARVLNKEIFETMYFAALQASTDKAKKYGPFPSYHGCPVSKGILQYDMWGVQPSSRWNWTALKADIARYGVRNSLLMAPMPTASTSQILGNNETIEPFTSNMYVRRTHAGEFICFNKYLVQVLQSRNLWRPDIINHIKAHYGSVQQLEELPLEVRLRFKTVFELSMKCLVDQMLDRAVFIDQSQSFNVWMETPDPVRLTRIHFYAWKRGGKTSMYYCRTRAAVEAQQVTVAPPSQPHTTPKNIEEPGQFCTMQDGCLSCQ